MTGSDVVMFDCVSVCVGDHCSGRAADGTRVVCRVEAAAWWIGPVLFVARLFRLGELAAWAVEHGLVMRAVANFRPALEEE